MQGGGATIAEGERRWGPLPPSFSSTSRGGLELDPLPRTVIAGAVEIRDRSDELAVIGQPGFPQEIGRFRPARASGPPRSREL